MPGAFEALKAGDTERHDTIVADETRRLATEVDVLVLAQAGMARVVDALPAGEVNIPVLTSPRSGIRQLHPVRHHLTSVAVRVNPRRSTTSRRLHAGITALLLAGGVNPLRGHWPATEITKAWIRQGNQLGESAPAVAIDKGFLPKGYVWPRAAR